MPTIELHSKDRLLALPAKVRLGWNWLTVVNILIYITASYFHPSLIFAGQAGNLSLEWSHISGFNLVNYSLVRIYLIKLELAASDQCTSLQYFRNN